MKKLALLGLTMILIGVIIMRKNDLITFMNKYISPKIIKVEIKDKNDFYREYDFDFVQNTDNFSPTNMQDLYNIYYTVLNSGIDSFTFYCPKEYKECTDDIEKIINNQKELSDINNYVHPFNSFSSIKTEYDNFGEVTIIINKTYNKNQIKIINEEVDKIYPELVSENNDLKTNIKNIHDYIINHTKYDSDRTDNGIINYKSDIAYGPLFEGYAICGGYTDLMEIFLNRMNVKNFKVSSNEHIWNAVEIDNKWYNLDLTWDDPVSSDGNDYLEYTFFLINTSQLLEIEPTQHNFDSNNYQELIN